jgi:adenine C2-methylase RlmN of 23S rRNA A2503 and tRNA A37
MEAINDKVKSDEIFRITFEYTKYFMVKHINDTIARKEEAKKLRHEAARANRKPKL